MWWTFQKQFLNVYLGLLTFSIFQLLEPLSCQLQADGSFSMVYNPSEKCFEGEWIVHMFIFVPLIFAYVILIPAVFAYALTSRWREDNQAQYEMIILPQALPYTSKYHYFELISILKKILLAVLFINIKMAIFKLLFCLILLIFTTLEQVLRPYERAAANSTMFMYVPVFSQY